MRKLVYLCLSLAVLSPASNAFAISKSQLDSNVKSALEKCKTEINGCQDVTKNSAGILVFPEVMKGGAGLAYETGKGALIENGQTTGYYSTNAASLGATLGGSTKSVIVSFKTPEELKKFKNSSNWEVGADGSIVMLRTGASASVDSETAKQSVVGVVFGEKGLMADASIKGAKVTSLEAKELQ